LKGDKKGVLTSGPDPFFIRLFPFFYFSLRPGSYPILPSSQRILEEKILEFNTSDGDVRHPPDRIFFNAAPDLTDILFDRGKNGNNVIFTGFFSSSPKAFIGDPMFLKKSLDSRSKALRE
jgi:hypothetical protein